MLGLVASSNLPKLSTFQIAFEPDFEHGPSITDIAACLADRLHCSILVTFGVLNDGSIVALQSHFGSNFRLLAGGTRWQLSVDRVK